MSFTNDEIGELWLLVFLNPSKLTDYEIDRLLEHREGLKNRIQHLWCTFPESLESVQRYRARKKEMAKLPTEELQAILDRRMARVQDFLDDPCDMDPMESSIEASPLDYDENIASEIVRERKAAEKTASGVAT